MQTLYKYKNHLIKAPVDIPRTPHFVVMLFDVHKYYSDDQQNSIETLNYYAFMDEDTWRKMVQEFWEERIHKCLEPAKAPKLVCFRSGGASEPKIEIVVKANFP